MKKNDDTNPGGADDASRYENAKGSSGSASPADAREPWRLAVAAAEAAADAQLGYRDEVRALSDQLSKAVVPSHAMDAVKERLARLEQNERTPAAPPSLETAPPSSSLAVKLILAGILIWLAGLTGVVARHWHDEAVAVRTVRAISNGGLIP